jgi:AcrR family transcriptional regulator
MILRVAQLCVVRKFDTLKLVTVVESQAAVHGPSVTAGTVGEPEGLRERKKAATRRALGLAAMRLAIERGLDNVRPEDIAAAAGFSTRTFNNYFASKYQAICALAMERGSFIGATLRSRPAGEPLMDAITAAVLEPYVRGERTYDRDWVQGVRLVLKSASLEGEYLRTQHATQRALAEAIADRIGSDLGTDMFPAVMAGAVTAAVHVAYERWLTSDPPVELVPLIKLALSQLRYPCGAAPADRGGDTPTANSLAVGPRAADPYQALRHAET